MNALNVYLYRTITLKCMNKLIIAISFLLLFSCNSQKSVKDQLLSDIANSDSLFVMKALEDAVKKVEKMKEGDSYSAEYLFPDSLNMNYIRPDLQVKLQYGFIFSENHKHLLVECESEIIASTNVFLLKRDAFEQVILSPETYYVQTLMSCLGDTIMDINGDGLKDYDAIWYPGNGCCRRNVHKVYLLKDDGSFTSEYEFMNPTFDPDNKLIRGVTYGHPGSTAELYKYKWNGFDVDELEYISHIWWDEQQTGFVKYINNDTLKINKIPEEYLGVYDIEWFIGDD